MISKELHTAYAAILREELLTAMGCTEPIAIAYAAALARDTLGTQPSRLDLRVSSNVVKNVKSVIVPNTNGLKGIEAAAAAGIVAGQAEKKLEVISSVTREQAARIAEYLSATAFSVCESDTGCAFDVEVIAHVGASSASVRLSNHHTNVLYITKDGETLYRGDEGEAEGEKRADRELLSVKDIVEYASTADLSTVSDLLQKQIDCNMAIASEGLNGKWGASVGKSLIASCGQGVQTLAKAMAAAASDARMSGCELPVVINSGSGNQGITASLPVVVYAREMGASNEMLYRALIVSNLVTIHLKTGIGRLSAYCGVVSAGCGAGAGVMYLHGGGYTEIAHTVVNALAINSGLICDGAKASCAAKIASSVEAGLIGMYMYMHGNEFVGGDGIVTKGVENTIRNVGALAREGMRETDKTILNIMLGKLQ